MSHVHRASIAVGLIASFVLCTVAVAQPLPAVNLGLTSFLDGGPPAGPGFYYQQYFQFYASNTFRDDDGDELSAVPDVTAIASLNQFIYQSDQPILFGGKWGVDVIVPIVSVSLDPDTFPFSDNNAGFGDILVGPFIQWDPIMGDNGPVFMHRFEFQTVYPTGEYDSGDAANPGANLYSINPYWSCTWFFLPKWEASTRIHYLWNSENDDPNPNIYGAGTDDIQPGQAIHLNFAASYELFKKFRAGVNGYYLREITDKQVGGADMDGREQVLGIGPGAIYSFSQNDHIFVNAYWEAIARNRAEGFLLILRWTHHF